MGNCIERCKNCSNRPEKEARLEEQESGEKKRRPAQDEEDNRKSGGMRVKIVLTKEELQMLMAELKSKQEEDEQAGKKIRSLEDVLDEIERVRRRSVNVNVVSSSSWKPSLESIAETESSEVMMTN